MCADADKEGSNSPSRVIQEPRWKVASDVYHNSLKLCSDRDLPIWLLRKHHELRGKYVGDRVLEHATDALSDPEDYGRGDNLGLEDLFAEMTRAEASNSRDGLGR